MFAVVGCLKRWGPAGRERTVEILVRDETETESDVSPWWYFIGLGTVKMVINLFICDIFPSREVVQQAWGKGLTLPVVVVFFIIWFPALAMKPELVIWILKTEIACWRVTDSWLSFLWCGSIHTFTVGNAIGSRFESLVSVGLFSCCSYFWGSWKQ